MSRGIRSILGEDSAASGWLRALRGAFLSSPVVFWKPWHNLSSVLAISEWQLVLGSQGPGGFSA